MELSTQNGEPILRADLYSMIFQKGRPFVFDETYCLEESMIGQKSDMINFSIAVPSTARETSG